MTGEGGKSVGGLDGGNGKLCGQTSLERLQVIATGKCRLTLFAPFLPSPTGKTLAKKFTV
jgi:hypothetical protein